eukprot:m.152603 g.152603  ORF g.152603 m.152603 type:complete len:64 (-) comp14263_c1_seq1:297-488(-)
MGGQHTCVFVPLRTLTGTPGNAKDTSLKKGFWYVSKQQATILQRSVKKQCMWKGGHTREQVGG